MSDEWIKEHLHTLLETLKAFGVTEFEYNGLKLAIPANIAIVYPSDNQPKPKTEPKLRDDGLTPDAAALLYAASGSG